MSKLTLYSNNALSSTVCQLVAELSKQELDIKQVEGVAAVPAETGIDAPFKLPALRIAQGFVCGVGAVIRCLGGMRPDLALLGHNLTEQTQVDLWVEIGLGSLHVSLLLDRDVEKVLNMLNSSLLLTAYLGTFHFTVADAICLCELAHNGLLLQQSPLTSRANICRWVDACMHNEAVSKVLVDTATAWCTSRNIPTFAQLRATLVFPRDSFASLMAPDFSAQPKPAQAASKPAQAASKPAQAASKPLLQAAAKPQQDQAKATPKAAQPAVAETPKSLVPNASWLLPADRPEAFVRVSPGNKPALRVSRGPFHIVWKGRDVPVSASVAAELLKIKLTFETSLKECVSMAVTKPDSSNAVLASDLEIVLFFFQEVFAANPEMWSWAQLAVKLALNDDFAEQCNRLNNHLVFRTFLVGNELSPADFAVFAALTSGPLFASIKKRYDLVHVERYLNSISKLPSFAAAEANLTAAKKPADSAAAETEEMGNFDVKLPGAEMGKVVTRFPPEPSGYLHIGHVKAALLNNTFARIYNGKMILRFDDTNPTKEKTEFEDSIVEDLKRIGVQPDSISRTSDFFPVIMKYGEKLLRDGNGYMDDTPQLEMQKQRMDGIESVNRNKSPEENLKLWNEMINATKEGKRWCMRAKIDMSSLNKALRDPVCFRCNDQVPHPHTGIQFKAYPTYDFACPIVDSVEGVTHALRDRQFHDRNAQYEWFLQVLELRPVVTWGFSRLNLKRCLLSKRKIQWFVDTGRVSGWDDPRVPTIRGILRRGMTVAALRKFVLSQGASKSLNLMSWDSLWTHNKRVLDPSVPRYTALSTTEPLCSVTVTNQKAFEYVTKSRHPKNDAVGTKPVLIGPQLSIEQEDAKILENGKKITLMNWGNAIVKKIAKKGDVVTNIEVELNLNDTDFKDTPKLTWLADDKTGDNSTPCELVILDHLITKDKLEEEDVFEDFVNENTMTKSEAVGDLNIRGLQQGDIIQLERKGFYIVDTPASGTSAAKLLYIPDGRFARDE